MRTTAVLLSLVFYGSALAEEPPAFTLTTGVALLEQTVLTKGTTQAVRVRKVGVGHEVFVQAFMPCMGAFTAPWVTERSASSATLVIQKQGSSSGFSSKEECLYKVRVSVAAGRLRAKGTLYVVANQVVVGHATVP